MQHSSPARRVIGFIGAVSAVLIAAALSPAHAVSVSPGQVLPNAISYEYFGLNFANNVLTSNTVGTLDYTGHPGCGGTCYATTTLGSSPSVFAQVNEVDAGASGGVVQVDLGYYVAYINAPGTYDVNLHAIDKLTPTSGVSSSAYLGFGPAGSNPGNFNDFASKTFEEADCLNHCPAPGFAFPDKGPFVANNTVQMQANTLYFMHLELLMLPGPNNTDDTAMIDPTFSTGASGGQFVFSPGIFTVATTPIPAALPLFASGLGGLGLFGWRRRGRQG